MLSNKHILMSIFCISGFISGAASYELVTGSEPAACSSKSTLQLSDCFKSGTVRVPGPPKFYERVVFGKSFDVASSLPSMLNWSSTSKIMCGVFGFVEGDNEETTEQAAKILGASLLTWNKSALSNWSGNRSVGETPEWIGRIIGKDVARLKYLLNTRIVLTSFQSSNDQRNPSMLFGSGRTLKGSLLPASVDEEIRKIEYVYDLNVDGKGNVAGLSAYAATLPASHEAPYLQFNPELYDQFLTQEFGE